MSKKGVKSKNVSKAKTIQKKPVGLSKQKTIPKPTKLNTSQKPVSFSNQQKQMYYWAIFFYGALILIILLGVLLLVKYGEDLAGKAANVAYTTEDINGDNIVTITSAEQGEIVPFTYNEKDYKLNIGVLTDGKLPVNLKECELNDNECVVLLNLQGGLK